MRFPIFLLAFSLLLSGCSSKDEKSAGNAQVLENRPPPSVSKPAGPRTLAYEHELSLQTQETKVAALYEKTMAQCLADTGHRCTILLAQIGSGVSYDARSTVTARLTLRATPEGIRNLQKTLSSGNRILKQSTKAEDLAQPMVDNEKRLAMLEEYKNRLNTLNARPGTDLDTLIKLSKEIASVQSELESAKSDAAKLAERVNTEVLRIEISINSEDEEGLMSPVKSACQKFIRHLAEGISIVITALAYILPWCIVLIPLLLGIGRWRRGKVKLR
ncbi:DUF4349 domain-containing protein [Undibacterium sp. TJN25]|uniref:DUF4349 domain-containing protein n=1 Tax=Undibacterium sp. TJN25 TaxID=3413056 RepID=UPI003BF3846A